MRREDLEPRPSISASARKWAPTLVRCDAGPSAQGAGRSGAAGCDPGACVHFGTARRGAEPAALAISASLASSDGRIPERRIDDGFEQALAPRGREVIVAEPRPFAHQPAEVS